MFFLIQPKFRYYLTATLFFMLYTPMACFGSSGESYELEFKLVKGENHMKDEIPPGHKLTTYQLLCYTAFLDSKLEHKVEHVIVLRRSNTMG